MENHIISLMKPRVATFIVLLFGMMLAACDEQQEQPADTVMDSYHNAEAIAALNAYKTELALRLTQQAEAQQRSTPTK